MYKEGQVRASPMLTWCAGGHPLLLCDSGLTALLPVGLIVCLRPKRMPRQFPVSNG